MHMEMQKSSMQLANNGGGTGSAISTKLPTVEASITEHDLLASSCWPSMLAVALALQVVPSGPKAYIAQQDKSNWPWHATVILLEQDRVVITTKRTDASVLFLPSAC
jgi:hypothetical protein